MLLNVFFLYLHILPSISGTITIVPYKKNKKIIKKNLFQFKFKMIM